MMESQWRILSDVAHQGETTVQRARVQCKKSKVTAVTRFIRWNQSRERLSKGAGKGQTGWVETRRRGSVKSIGWPDLTNELRYMVTSEMTRRLKRIRKESRRFAGGEAELQ